ncbi:LysR family transcriptional regulator [Sneathiella chinensis]|uniref:LysR family transcriptional regulator n=1 Tax=Sneathiella chinensis TaxID=349750 RepID=A0ABQ5TZY9_9PROT|nr:LysR family transcriptional regulator [Sneathiella chinensis]GLQ05138.1 LysR family transcriptional regulator [Sneathiella chinensis]
MTGDSIKFTPERLARDLDWNLLKTFQVIAKSKSITDAANTLRLRQPSVSASLKRLEERLGKKLIERSPGNFRLTRAGELLEREIVEIHGTILRLETLLRDTEDEIRGHVRIAMASHVECPFFDNALSQFHQQHPNATLSIEISASRHAIENLMARKASVAICLVKDRSPKLNYKRLFREHFGLFCGPEHPLFGKENLTSSDLAGHSSVSFVTDQMGDALRQVALMRAQADLADRIVGTSANLEEVRRMIIAGLGIGPLPIHVAKRDVDNGILWRLPPYVSPPAIDVYVVENPKAQLNRAEQAFCRIIHALIDSTPIEDRIYG